MKEMMNNLVVIGAELKPDDQVTGFLQVFLVRITYNSLDNKQKYARLDIWTQSQIGQKI